MIFTFEYPHELTSTNHGLRAHWSLNHRRTKAARAAVAACLSAFAAFKPDVATAQNLRVAIQRVAPRALDDDNLRGAIKATRDEVAAWLGIADNDPRVAWDYPTQDRRGVRQHVVVVTLSHDGPQPAGLPTERRVFTADELESGAPALVPARPPAPKLAQRCAGSGKPCDAAPRVTCPRCRQEVSTRAKGETVVMAPHTVPAPADDAPEPDRRHIPLGGGVPGDRGHAGAVEDCEASKPAAGAPPRPVYVALPSEQKGVDDDELRIREVRRDMPGFDGAPPTVRLGENEGWRTLTRHDYEDGGRKVWLYVEVVPPTIRRRDGTAVARK